MLTLTAPAGAWRYPAYVTDGDGKAGIRREGRLIVDGHAFTSAEVERVDAG